MEWLMIIAFIVISVMDSKRKSDVAKQKHAQRQQAPQQQVYRSDDAQKKSVQQKNQGSFLGSLTEFLETLEETFEDGVPQGKEHPASKPTSSRPVPNTQTIGKSHTNKKKKTEQQTAKKSPAQLPNKTLMEQRPGREQREEYTKVSANVKPLTASVKPLKNAYENDEKCEHRIELNPNIQYSKQQKKVVERQAVVVNTDSQSIVQGIIWSEILGKPKAYQKQMKRIGR